MLRAQLTHVPNKSLRAFLVALRAKTNLTVLQLLLVLREFVTPSVTNVTTCSCSTRLSSVSAPHVFQLVLLVVRAVVRDERTARHEQQRAHFLLTLHAGALMKMSHTHTHTPHSPLYNSASGGQG